MVIKENFVLRVPIGRLHGAEKGGEVLVQLFEGPSLDCPFVYQRQTERCIMIKRKANLYLTRPHIRKLRAARL